MQRIGRRLVHEPACSRKLVEGIVYLRDREIEFNHLLDIFGGLVGGNGFQVAYGALQTPSHPILTESGDLLLPVRHGVELEEV